MCEKLLRHLQGKCADKMNVPNLKNLTEHCPPITSLNISKEMWQWGSP